ncbi:hypothetical protein ACHAXT_004284 [Thalassiosira profunda]
MSDQWTWREGAPNASAVHKPRNNGIDPSSFHTKPPSSDHQTSNLNTILQLAAQNEVVERRKQYTTSHKAKMQAYRDVTSFRIFPLQDMATEYLEEMQSNLQTEHTNYKRRKIKHGDSPLWSMEPRIFALETSSTGKRRYIVSNLGRFMQHYWQESDPRRRHYYELIREQTPCRLYFDLEYSKEANPHISYGESEELMTEFIGELGSEFQAVHGIQMDRTCIVDLDSSTDTKFSRHLIVHLPKGELFADAYAAGVFAKRFVGRLAEEQATGVLARRRAVLAQHLFVNSQGAKAESDAECSTTNGPKSEKSSTCFIDLAVYTRNRLFRLMGSTKYGKSASAALRIADANTYPFPAGFDNSKFYLKGESVSKACPTDERNERLPSSLSQDHDAFCASLDWEMHADALARTLVVPENATRTGAPILVEPSGSGAECNKPSRSSYVSRQSKPLSRSNYGASPVPKLDSFILSLSNQGGIQGEIRTWSVEHGVSGTYILTYQMCKNRWCENIGRPHKSNNILWRVDVASQVYWQQCHDPECQMMNFRGTIQPLPDEVAENAREYLLELQMAELDEDEIIINDAKRREKGSQEFPDSALDKELGSLDMSRFTAK